MRACYVLFLLLTSLAWSQQSGDLSGSNFSPRNITFVPANGGCNDTITVGSTTKSVKELFPGECGGRAYTEVFLCAWGEYDKAPDCGTQKCRNDQREQIGRKCSVKEWIFDPEPDEQNFWSSQRKVRIEFRSRITGFIGHGSECMSERDAADWLSHLRYEYPELEHWVSTCK